MARHIHFDIFLGEAAHTSLMSGPAVRDPNEYYPLISTSPRTTGGGSIPLWDSHEHRVEMPLVALDL